MRGGGFPGTQGTPTAYGPAGWRMNFSVFDDLLRHGLYFGTIFQLIVIGAIIFVPPKYDDCTDHLEVEPNGTDTTDVMATEKAEHPENTTAIINKNRKKVRRRK